jgi:AbrB family looped-hinge helix DNA binding protein
MAETAVVTSRGQMVIPARLRKRYGIRKGTRVSMQEDGPRIILEPITPEFIRSLKGSARGKRNPLKILFADRRRERKL